MIREMFHYWKQARAFTKFGFVVVFGVILQLGYRTPATAQEVAGGCGVLALQGRFGPYDYRANKYIPESTYGSHRALLSIVEGAHFTPEVESLLRGKSAALPGSDIAYTLHAFPNHHRALIAVATLSEKEKKARPTNTPYEVECWFKRAVTFRPDDNIVRLIYASFLSTQSRQSEAVQQLEFVASNAGDNAFTYNNIGMVYFDMKDYDKALAFAHKAYDLGLGIPTLKEQLIKVNKWTEPSNSSSGEIQSSSNSKPELPKD